MPIASPDGRELVTLRDAGEYIQSLPKEKHKRPEWLLAVEMLIAAVEERGPLMFAEIAVRKAVNAEKAVPNRRYDAKQRRSIGSSAKSEPL
jgi:hypothetical protein